MTNIELQFYTVVPTALRDIAKELKSINENLAAIRQQGQSDMLTVNSVSANGLSQIKGPKDAATFLKDKFYGLDHEEVWALLLDNTNRVLEGMRVGMGDIKNCSFNSRKIIQRAVSGKTTGVILFHNHPSGDVTPSKSDISLTENMRDRLKVFDLSLIDHVIMSDENYFSFAEEQTFKF